MTSVLVLRDGLPGLHPLIQDLGDAGFTVLAEVDDRSKLVQATVRHAPDVVVGEARQPNDALFKATQALADVAPCPVLLFTSDADPAHTARAVADGVHAWVVIG